MPVLRETEKKARRKPPEDRRQEILEMGAEIGLAEGLGKVTARRLADGIGVRPGLVTHYFPTVDLLLAQIFAALGSAGRLGFSLGADETVTPTNYLRGLVGRYTATDRDPVSLMWLDAWRQAADRPQLRDAVTAQMESDVAALTDVIERGVATGEFDTTNAPRSAMRIFGLLDGQIVASVVRAASVDSSLDYATVVEMTYESIERELGLPAGTLH